VTAWFAAHEAQLWWLGVGSAVTCVVSLATVPWLAVRIPADYFTRERRPDLRWSRLHPGLRVVLQLGRNLLGVVLVGMGIAMLVLPGQGVLTILLGMMLLEFPGKYTLECWLASRPAVYRTLNWLRGRAGVPPIQPPRGHLR
jgi:hypothetical protein